MIYAGDECLSHEQQHPELYDRGPFRIGPDVEGWPIDYPCEECGAVAGEECRPYCTGQDSDAEEEECPTPHVVVRQCPGWWPAREHAVCKDCGWTGPTRDQNQTTGRALIRCDQADQRCE